MWRRRRPDRATEGALKRNVGNRTWARIPATRDKSGVATALAPEPFCDTPVSSRRFGIPV